MTLLKSSCAIDKFLINVLKVEDEEKDVEMTEKAASENGEADNNTENMRNSR